ncbi:MAG: BspA family leucine-rich repeat surface protein [Clostridia bacterium]|nr:BspA family leucine-rich repeat surface protein [Clostridia bacterium]
MKKFIKMNEKVYKLILMLLISLVVLCSFGYARENTAPTGAISVDNTYTMKNGNKAVPSRDVTLRIMASDSGSGVNRVCILNENELNSISFTNWTDSSFVATGTANTKTKAWTLSTGDGEKTIYLIVEDQDGNTTVVPSTTFRYTINYNLKGGSNGPSAGAKEVGKAYTISSTIPTKTNYDFMGWDTSSAGTSKVYSGGDKYYTNADLTLYAYWQPHYTIKFNGNGSTGGSTADQGMTYGVAKNLTANGFTRTGYTYSKWNTQANGSGTNYNNQQSVNNLTSTAGGTFNLYAQWNPITYTISFNGNGNTGGSTSGMSMTYDVAKNLTANGFTKTGHSFSKWNTQAAGGGTNYNNQQSVGNLTSTAGGTVTLYAQWTPDTYTVSYNKNAGSDTVTNMPSNQTKTYGVTLTLSGNTPVRSGYEFKGWGTSSSATTASYQPGGSYTANSATTLYAIWNELDAKYVDGKTFALAIKRLAGNNISSYADSDSSITSIAWSNSAPNMSLDSAVKASQYRNISSSSLVDVSSTAAPIYAWFDNGAIKLYSNAERITLNSDVSCMFYGLTKLSSLNVRNNLKVSSTSNVTNMNRTFYNVGGSVTTLNIDLSVWDTSNVTDMSNTFERLGFSATTINLTGLSNLNTSSVTDMSNMFYYSCYNATAFNLDLSRWNVSNVTNMSGMFSGAGTNAETWSIGNLSRWNTSNVTKMNSMFSLAGEQANTFSLDLSSWNISNVTTISGMFNQAGRYSSSFSLNLSGWNTANITSMSYTFYQAGEKAQTINLNLSGWNTSNVTTMKSLFNDFGADSTTFTLSLVGWNTANVTDMSSTFEHTGENATTWSIGDLSGWKTSNVTTMQRMFFQAGKKATTWNIGNLSNWNTSKVTNMGGMFYEAGSKSGTWNIGNVGKWDVSKVTSMYDMFYDAGESATTWYLGDLSGWNTSSVTSMGLMFCGAGANTTSWSIGNLSGWNTSSVTEMYGMFLGTGAKSTTWNIGNISNWNVSNVTDMSSMFRDSCGSKSSPAIVLDLSNWNTSNVTDMERMFSNAHVSTIYASNKFVTTQVTSSTNMFEYCNSLVGGAGTTYNTSNPKDKTYAHIDGGTSNPGYFTRKP